MENWGLTTYREGALLFDPHKSSASDKLGITMVIAHELAHQVGTSVQMFRRPVETNRPLQRNSSGGFKKKVCCHGSGLVTW